MADVLCFLDTHSGAVIAIATVLLVVVTGGLVWVAFFQFKTTRGQLRAYVFPIAVEMTNVRIDGTPEFVIKIKNTGQTPAYDLRHVAQVLYGAWPFVGEFPENSKTPKEHQVVSKCFLGPHGELITRSRGESISPETFRMLTSEKAALYAYGQYWYVDAFRKDRWVKYRFMVGGDYGVKSDCSTVACEEGNETSEDRE